MSNVVSAKKLGFWPLVSLGLTGMLVFFALVSFVVIKRKPELNMATSSTLVTASDPEPLNGVATGDSYVLVIYTMSGTPDTGLLYRHNARLEAMGYKMDPNTFRVSEGNSQCAMHAVYHKIK